MAYEKWKTLEGNVETWVIDKRKLVELHAEMCQIDIWETVPNL